MAHYPTREDLREHAAEEAEIKVSALLQTFTMPRITQAQIRQLLIDAVTNTFVAGYASGWDAALDEGQSALGKVERYMPKER